MSFEDQISSEASLLVAKQYGVVNKEAGFLEEAAKVKNDLIELLKTNETAQSVGRILNRYRDPLVGAGGGYLAARLQSALTGEDEEDAKQRRLMYLLGGGALGGGYKLLKDHSEGFGGSDVGGTNNSGGTNNAGGGATMLVPGAEEVRAPGEYRPDLREIGVGAGVGAVADNLLSANRYSQNQQIRRGTLPADLNPIQTRLTKQYAQATKPTRMDKIKNSVPYFGEKRQQRGNQLRTDLAADKGIRVQDGLVTIDRDKAVSQLTDERHVGKPKTVHSSGHITSPGSPAPPKVDTKLYKTITRANRPSHIGRTARGGILGGGAAYLLGYPIQMLTDKLYGNY